MKRIGRLEVIAFVTGFALMAYELVAARILAPTIGSSTYVWTSVIGVIIAALSLGYWAGGRLADMRNNPIDVVGLNLLSAAGAIVTYLTYGPVLEWVVTTSDDPRGQAVLASIVLFVPTSFVLGMISPYLAKLNVTSLSTSGQAIAHLSALNSVGGIAGTFMTGFVLFGAIGSRQTLAIVVVMLVLVSWLLVPRLYIWQRAAVSVGLLALTLVPAAGDAGAIIVDTPSATYRVETVQYGDDEVVGLLAGPRGIQSGVYSDGRPDLAFWYTRELARLALEEQPKDILVLGGGAFVLPQFLGVNMPDSHIDVVEIDEKLLDTAREYFNYTDPTNVTPIFGDARAYLERTDRQYDMIMVDVYSDLQIPFTLMSAEYGRLIAERLRENGLVAMNLVAGLAPGPCRDVFAAFDRTYRQELPYGAYSTQVNQTLIRGNHVVVYGRQPIEIDGLKSLKPLDGPLYTDDFTPSERLSQACEQERQRYI